ncbi:hypothetical protein QVD17_13202 [Tagetes erecta]|uniref:Uncharacterized protein n=1 Tax=Tagetes erecta TaxID=13708 RepID=A0AAD8L0F3_TARER|nr:hypothetical protein QVD17_13202 [Tagetes erecta]
MSRSPSILHLIKSFNFYPQKSQHESSPDTEYHQQHPLELAATQYDKIRRKHRNKTADEMVESRRPTIVKEKKRAEKAEKDDDVKVDSRAGAVVM